MTAINKQLPVIAFIFLLHLSKMVSKFILKICSSKLRDGRRSFKWPPICRVAYSIHDGTPVHLCSIIDDKEICIFLAKYKSLLRQKFKCYCRKLVIPFTNGRSFYVTSIKFFCNLESLFNRLSQFYINFSRQEHQIKLSWVAIKSLSD